MNVQKEILAQFNSISLSYNDKKILDDVSNSIVTEDKIGLIGINGSGKSSLLKCISGIIKPDSGNISNKCSIEYVPQLDLKLYRRRINLYEYIEEIYDNWWEVTNYYEYTFKATLKEIQSLDTLSGGELVKLNISIALCKLPEIILLDEPTNHLDFYAINQLKKALCDTNIAFIIVSHNIDFLNDVVKNMWEIENGKLTSYGGNYDFYRSEKNNKIQSQFNHYKTVKKQLKKEKASLQKEKLKYQKVKAKSDKMAKINDRSAPKIIRNSMRRKIQTSFASKKADKDKQIQKTISRLSELKIKKRKLIKLELESDKKTGLILSISNGDLILDDQTKIIEGINLNIHHGDRIAVLGDNGSGKTTFVKQLSYKNKENLHGIIKYGKGYETLYVDQKYDIVNPDLTIIENVQKYNNTINYETIRNNLGNMMFRSDWDINKRAANLSGGETARLAFAIVMGSNIDLLILDEPTNNLDIETIQVITESLTEFKGTIVAISHDIHFLRQIGIKDFYFIEKKSNRKCNRFLISPNF